MRQILCSFLLLLAISACCYSCSNGDYVANSSNPANGSVNPLNPLTTSQFTWPAVGQFSASINGAAWVADTAYYYLDTNGANVVIAYKNNMKQSMELYTISTWQGSLYNMGHLQYLIQGDYSVIDSPSIDVYSSYLGNSGEIYVQQNDTAVFMGRFYFQGVTSKGAVVSISNGYFNLNKF